MPTDTIVVTLFVTAVITVFALAIAWGERQTEGHRHGTPR
jgi:hypothetical protein